MGEWGGGSWFILGLENTKWALYQARQAVFIIFNLLAGRVDVRQEVHCRLAAQTIRQLSAHQPAVGLGEEWISELRPSVRQLLLRAEGRIIRDPEQPGPVSAAIQAEPLAGPALGTSLVALGMPAATCAAACEGAGAFDLGTALRHGVITREASVDQSR